MRALSKIVVVVVGLLISISVSAVSVETLDFSGNHRSKLIELEAAKQKIQDTISIYNKSMSKAQKDQLRADLKALRKCKFTQPCLEEMTNRPVKN